MHSDHDPQIRRIVLLVGGVALAAAILMGLAENMFG
jgi:hypothetical protein